MPSYGTRSLRCVAECHPKLQLVLNETIKHYDSSCIWGYRDRKTQDAAYADGYSQLRWPRSKHNRKPSRAFDLIPYPNGFKATTLQFYIQATHVLRAASKVGVSIKWGGHWRSLKDLAHFELDSSEL